MGNPHILAIPYPAQGHVIPLLMLSQCLSKNGFRITFLNTINNLSFSNGNLDKQIHLLSVFYGFSYEATLRALPEKVEELIQEINSSESDKISCVLADVSLGWALEMAEKHEIRRAAFCPASASQLVLTNSIPKLIEDGIIDENGNPIKEQIMQISPGMPVMDTAKFVWLCLGNKEAQKKIFGIMVKASKALKLTEWLLCNSTYELEPETFHLAPRILPIGPLSEIKKQEDSTENVWPEDSNCLNWLDQNPPLSVIYVAFGSSTVFNTVQFQEFAFGLELTNRPFLWVVRSDACKDSHNAFFEEFGNRVGSRGEIVSWAPQQKVLAHDSVACFVSHCGWNSTMEGVSNGIPFLCCPYFADQFFNQTYICEIWKTGLQLNRDEDGIITREEIKNKVEKLFKNGVFKTRASALKEIVLNSVKENGKSSQNLHKFVEWVKEQ